MPARLLETRGHPVTTPFVRVTKSYALVILLQIGEKAEGRSKYLYTLESALPDMPRGGQEHPKKVIGIRAIHLRLSLGKM